MEKNFKRLVIANGVLFAFAILATIIERVTVPDQLARAIQDLYGTPSSILGDFLVLVFYLLVYFYGLYSAYKFQSLGRLILTATVLFVFMDVDFGKHSLVGSMEGLFVSLELITYGALLALMWVSPLATKFRDDDDTSEDDVIEMGQDEEPKPSPKKPRTRRKSTQQKDSTDD
ncbi:MAG: hypothetical protein CMD66_09700 [Gammaproteobacteria bacterium]|nr:hypothetical protein [Gammaproteobacteria bacterium]|tara:strand:- start:345 stop:863 length:519 start_codon:yes stop_codon:yes gene_type:complete